MDDDFNAPRAIGALFDLGRSINRAAPSATPAAVAEAQDRLRDLLGVLGIEVEEGAADAADAAPYIELLVEIRGMAREARQWELADHVRDRLADLDVVLEDTPDGTVWRRTTPTDP